jgi:hypothetical protein
MEQLTGKTPFCEPYQVRPRLPQLQLRIQDCAVLGSLEQIGFKLNHFVIQFRRMNPLYHIDMRATEHNLL